MLCTTLSQNLEQVLSEPVHIVIGEAVCARCGEVAAIIIAEIDPAGARILVEVIDAVIAVHIGVMIPDERVVGYRPRQDLRGRIVSEVGIAEADMVEARRARQPIATDHSILTIGAIDIGQPTCAVIEIVHQRP